MKRSVLVLVVLVATALVAGSTSYAASDGSAQQAHRAHQATTRGVKHVPVPKAGRAVDTSHPDHVIGHGTAAGCTGAKVVRAVAKGGVITFDCGPDPVVIAMSHTAKVFNQTTNGTPIHRVVIDGGGRVTLSGMGSGGSSTRTPATRSAAGAPTTVTTRHCRTSSSST